MDFTICIICDKSCDIGETVFVTRGLETLRSFSFARNDGIYGTLQELESVTVHVQCRKDYTCRAGLQSTSSSLSSVTSDRQVLTSNIGEVNYKTQHLFCEKVLNEHERYRHPVRQPQFTEVRMLHVNDAIRSMAERRDDEWGRSVQVRLAGVIDLVAAEGRYHQQCYTYFSRC